jgi:UMF1 family MFS transporter
MVPVHVICVLQPSSDHIMYSHAAMRIATKPIISWALYDWANSTFATTVMAGFFPVFFKSYWSVGADVTESTFQLGLANSIAGVIIMILAPVSGAIADRGGALKKFLLLYTALGVVMTGGLYFVAQGRWELAALLYMGASIGFAGGNVFYDALIVAVAPKEKLDVVSALGYSLGYLGGGLLFALNVAMTLWPQLFGFADAAQAVRASFLMVAVWWAVFTIPAMVFVKETGAKEPYSAAEMIRGGWRQLAATFHHIRRLRPLWLFLIAYWCYIDAVDTIIRMAVDYGMSLGFAAQNLIVALLITQFVGFPAALMFGKLGERLGAKAGVLIAIAVYIGITLWAMAMNKVVEFYILAVVIGLVQGGIQSLSRSLYASMIPPDKSGEFFGFYNMLGKFATVLGPVLMGVVGLLTGDPRLSLLAVVALLVTGAALLFLVDMNKHRNHAGGMDPA